MKKTKKEKLFVIDVDVKFTQFVHAKTRKDAIKKTKDSFQEEYNISITDEEIIKITERK
jgi:hypothetical protein